MNRCIGIQNIQAWKNIFKGLWCQWLRRQGWFFPAAFDFAHDKERFSLFHITLYKIQNIIDKQL